MIISRQKPFNEILSLINNRSVFVMGCSECATLCHAGGEPEVKEICKNLEENDIVVTGWIILDPACHLLNDKRLLKSYREDIQRTDVILVLACGNGVQTVAELYPDKDVITGTDTLFLGEIKHVDQFERRCNLCGTCIVNEFNGLCPLSRCPKHLLNGPCGGAKDGKCEVDENMPCVWVEILNKQKMLDQKEKFFRIIPPHDWSKSTIMDHGGKR